VYTYSKGCEQQHYLCSLPTDDSEDPRETVEYDGAGGTFEFALLVSKFSKATTFCFQYYHEALTMLCT